MKKLILILLLLTTFGLCEIARSAPVDMWPWVQNVILVDSASANPYTQFVTDTAAIGAGSSRARSLIDHMIIVRKNSLLPKSIGISSVTYVGANVRITVTGSIPWAFAAGDSVWFMGGIAYTYETREGMADTLKKAILEEDTAGHGGDPTIAGSIVSGGTGGMSQLPDSLFDHLAAILTAINLRPLTTDLPIITQAGLDSLKGTSSLITWVAEYLGIPCDSSFQVLYPNTGAAPKDSVQVFCRNGGVNTYRRSIYFKHHNANLVVDTVSTRSK